MIKQVSVLEHTFRIGRELETSADRLVPVGTRNDAMGRDKALTTDRLTWSILASCLEGE